MRMLISVFFVCLLLSGCTSAPPSSGSGSTVSQWKQADILDKGQAYPFTQSRTEADGRVVHPTYASFDVDAAAAALADIPRPWTGEKMTQIFQSTSDPKRKAQILWILAASLDPRAAVTLGEHLKDKSLDVRWVATYGLMDFFMDTPVSGGTEQHMQAAWEWWAKNEQRLRAEAEKLNAMDSRP